MEGDNRPVNEGSAGGSGSSDPAGSPPPSPAQGPSPLPPPPAAPAPPAPAPAPPAPAPYTLPPGYPAPPPAAPQYGAPPQTPYPAPPPYQPPAYPPPPQHPQYGAPATYAPPAPQGYAQPMPVQPGFAPPPAARGGGGRTLLIVGGIALFLIVVLAVGGVLLNASLSSTYNPGKAVQAYFAAQSRGDVGYMVANANYLKGDTGTDAFFGKDGLTAMVALKENKSVSGVSVSSNEELDSSTSKVTVSMQWNGSQVSETYTLHRDTSRTHFVFYNDWKLDIPAHSISITVPNQPGALQIDGIDVPTGASSVSVIQGYHNVTMAKSDFYDESDQSANAVDGAATVAFDGKVSADALAAAAKAIDDTFAGHCDATKYSGCPGHVYHPKAGTYEIFTLPGGEVDAYSSWQFTLVGHPSAGMTLTVSTEAGKATASGNCTVKLVVDGKSSHTYSGAWTADLTYDTGAWGTDVTFDCVKRQA